MRPEDVLIWLRAVPFRPFRITMADGQTFDVRHPKLIRLMRTSLTIFTPSETPDVFDEAQMIGLVLIDKIEPIDAPTAA